MLESAFFKYDDIRAIRVFFMDDREMATDRLMAILDNILSVSMTKLGHFSDKMSVTVDYELRAFMSDQKKVSECQLEYCENSAVASLKSGNIAKLNRFISTLIAFDATKEHF